MGGTNCAGIFHEKAKLVFQKKGALKIYHLSYLSAINSRDLLQMQNKPNINRTRG